MSITVDPSHTPRPPRSAATVVLLRAAAGGGPPAIFMLRRSARSPFMPDALVFPGGAVDPGDGPAGSDEAFVAAAIRECREEAGVDLGARRLHWFDTWVTPSAEPRRYEARFFLVDLAADEGGDAIADGHETLEGRWASAAEYLAQGEAGTVDLPPPTLCTLMRLADGRLAGLRALAPDEARAPLLPKAMLEAGPDGEARIAVVLPHDPGYAELPGDGQPLPPRAGDLPTRLVRVGMTWKVALGTCAVLALLACESTPAPVNDPASVVAAAEAPAPVAAVTHALIPWLDPDAGSAVYTRVDARVDLEAVARLFAIPPRAAHMFRDLHAFDDGLAALMEGVAPAPATWLRAEALVYLPPIARGPYVVRGLSRPRAEVEAFLLAGGLERDVMEGLVTFSPLPGDPDEPMAPDALPVHRAPAAAFPWRIVFLEDDVIGCYSLGEIGGGLGPLTAARDLPASELETRLTQEFAEDPEMALDLVASGPTLSLDISDDVGAVRLGMRRWEHSGLDGELILHPLGDPDVATKQLEARKPGGETDVVRELYDRIAFTPEPPVVRGRLQMTEADLRLLARGGG